MAAFTIAAEEFSITSEQGALKTYRFGSGKAPATIFAAGAVFIHFIR